MRKLGLLLWMLAFTAVGAQAQNIIKSLERTVPGQGKVTIHQDPKIEALIGVERPSMGEQKVLKAAGFRMPLKIILPLLWQGIFQYRM